MIVHIRYVESITYLGQFLSVRHAQSFLIGGLVISMLVFTTTKHIDSKQLDLQRNGEE